MTTFALLVVTPVMVDWLRQAGVDFDFKPAEYDMIDISAIGDQCQQQFPGLQRSHATLTMHSTDALMFQLKFNEYIEFAKSVDFLPYNQVE